MYANLVGFHDVRFARTRIDIDEPTHTTLYGYKPVLACPLARLIFLTGRAVHMFHYGRNPFSLTGRVRVSFGETVGSAPMDG